MRIVRTKGDPYHRGLMIGRELAGSIREVVAFYADRAERGGFDRARREGLLQLLLEAARRGMPDEIATLQGMADGAGQSLFDVMLPNTLEEFEPTIAEGGPSRRGSLDRCSALSVITPVTTLIGHNEEFLASEPGEIVLIVEVPDDPREPAVVSPGAACWLPSNGMNDAGHAQAVMALSASDSRLAIPRTLVSRSALGGRDRADVLERVAVENRSGGYAYLHAIRGGDAFCVETTATRIAVADGPAVHANHYLDAALAEVGSPPSDGSLARQARLEQLVAQVRPTTPEAVMEILRDHGSVPEGICTHPNPEDGDDAMTILFSTICDVEAGRIWVATGRPCEAEYEPFDISDLVGDRS